MTQYTSQSIEQKIKVAARIRISQKKNNDKRYVNDAGYWDGGRCNYGGTHNLVEDCEKLANFFTEITQFKNARQELMEFTNQNEFDKNKQSLLTRFNNSLDGLQMKTSNSTSIAGVCIIWQDFEKQFNSILDDFRKDLDLLKKSVDNASYNEFKELQKINIEERGLKQEIEENERKAQNEPDDNKKKQFIFLADQAKDQWKELLKRKAQLKSANLGDNFNPDSHIDNFLQKLEDKLTGKNRPVRPLKTSRSEKSNFDNQSSAETSQTAYSNHSPNSDEPKPFLEKHWKKIVFAIIFLTSAYYILNNSEDHENST